MLSKLKQFYGELFPRKVPKGAPSKKQFGRMTLAQRKALKLVVNGKEILVIDMLKQNAKSLPPMERAEGGKKYKINHERELIKSFLYCGFIGVYNYLKDVQYAIELQKVINELNKQGIKA